MRHRSIESTYRQLTPQERFRLILAARARGDEAEGARLARSGQRINLTMWDHAPHVDAFKELALHVYIELLDHVARFEDAIAMVRIERVTTPDILDSEAWPVSYVRAAGFLVREYTDAWRLFCEGRGLPPFLYWEIQPGYERVQGRLSQAEEIGYSSTEFLAWINEVRPSATPQLLTNRYTAQGIARQFADTLDSTTRWWGGKSV